MLAARPSAPGDEPSARLSEARAVSGHDGSTTLTDEQSEWFKEKLGVRYVTVQTNADVPSRKQRRAAVRAAKRRNNGTRKEG